MGNFTNFKFQRKTLLDFISHQEPSSKIILENALSMAEEAHQFQFREEGVGYIIHPIRVAIILFSELKIFRSDILAAALLHDVVEDSEKTIEDIEANFGKKISGLVQNLTRERPKREKENEKKESKKKKFRELSKASQDTRVIKCADLLDNMRSWKLINKENSLWKKFPRWIKEAKEYYIPIADSTNQYLASEMREIMKEY